MDYWKTKVLPKIKKVFDKNSTKKAAAAEVCKTFDDSKEEYSKEFEEKKTELQPKVIEIYEASSTEIKALVKEPKDAGLKKHSAGVQKLLDELVKIEFPGSKAICEASSKFGPTLLPGPIFFVFEKVSTFIVTEEKAEEPPPETSAAVAEETGGKEIVVEEGKKEEVVAVVAEGEPAVAEPPLATAEPPKVEEPVAAEPPKP
ncbi:Plasma membrane-associated cation-binding protein 1 [Camellia lanceoleosa]|uniref:Plasma membrane-associated cation-binding protein 1 n=1 Tax=Camellia lanceoleosa TaxID=1840588 RepID=A0ACC0GN10_9ERIC|nr:Plasma membrane-associated cation-binding protein 1 [Camellia lanceoleosa]